MKKTVASLTCAAGICFLVQCDDQASPPKNCPAVIAACVPHVLIKADLPAESWETRPVMESVAMATDSTSASTVDVFNDLWDSGPSRLRIK